MQLRNVTNTADFEPPAVSRKSQLHVIETSRNASQLSTFAQAEAVEQAIETSR